MNEFQHFHPIVNFIYFTLVIALAVLLLHPVCLMLSFVCALSYFTVLRGGYALLRRLMYILPMIVVMALLNPAFNHAGITVLTYLPSGNPLTKESIVYGIFAAMMIANVTLWFSCYHDIMTSDKFIYLFGRILPSLSLLLSMTLRFIPKFAAQLRVVKQAQRSIGRDMSQGGLFRRAKHALAIFSAMVTWALESSIQTADSMRSRGYGLPGRTAFSIFTFDKRDAVSLSLIGAFGIYTIIGIANGALSFSYFPFLHGSDISPYFISVLASDLALCIFPIILELREVRRWKSIESKI